MDRPIRIKASGIELTAELNSARTARIFRQVLPLHGHADLRGMRYGLPAPVNVFGRITGDVGMLRQVSSGA